MGCRSLLWASLCLLVLALTGCSTGPSTSGSVALGASKSSGSVHGGQQPVVGASIQLYTVGTTGNGSAATPLLTSPVTTDATGSFTITGLYSCSGATQVYIVATGGNPGLATTNPNIALMAALGPCSSLTSSTFISINELTTVAAVTSLAPFMSNITAIGAPSSDTPALNSAFVFANELVDSSTGTSPGTNVPSGYTVPTAELNTLADILSGCINSTGGTAGDGSLCGTLFSLTTVGANTAPTNTIAALLNLANNSTLNTSALYALEPPTPPFQPALISTPPDFQIRLAPPSGSLVLQISPSSITFPDTAVSFGSQPQTVTIQNTGGSAITFGSIAITGTNAADFAVNSGCTASLDPESSCTVQVTATPSAKGARNAYLAINSTSPDSPQYVALSVNGTAPAAGPISLSTTSLSFTLAGVLQDVTLTNYGNTPLTIRSIIEAESGATSPSNPHFAVANSNCGTSLAAQSVCTISIVSTFASADGVGTPISESGTVTITDDASTGPQTISLSSRNLGTIASTAPASSSLGIISFPATQLSTTIEAQAQYMGYNAYDEAGWPSISPSISGANSSDFGEVLSVVGTSGNVSNCTPPLYGGVCVITFSFTPTAAGSRSAKATFPSGYILLTGTGVGPGPSFRVDQASLSMQSFLPVSPDPKSVGTFPVTVTNNGTTTLSVGASFTGANPSYMSANTSSCASVAPQTSCTVTVSFTAPALGNYSANLVLKDNNSSFSVAPIPISATTAYWPPETNPGLLSFSSQVGTTSEAQSFVIYDPNGYPVGHPLSVTLQTSSSFVLTQGSTCPASTTQTCTLSVAFAPQTLGMINETATITDQTTGLHTVIALIGTGTGTPSYTLSANSITFAARGINTTSIPTVVTLTSNGTQSLTVTGISMSGAVNNNFTQTNNCSSVPVNSTCSINITFAPTVTGTQSATVQIMSDAPTSPSTISVSGTAQ